MDLAKALLDARGRVDQVRQVTDQSGQAIECCTAIADQLNLLAPISDETGISILGQVSDLLREYLGLICCEESAPEQEEAEVEELPQPSPPQPVKVRRPQFQVPLDTVKFLRVVLSQARIPNSIEKALELAYGSDWRDTTIVRPVGPGKIIRIRREDDLVNPAGSVFKKKLADSFRKLRQYQEGVSPEGVDVSDQVVRLTELLGRHRWTTIQSRMTAWGL